MAVCDRQFCDFACYFRADERLRVWRVYRSSHYWRWLEPLLLRFHQCVLDRVEPPSDLFVNVNVDALELARNGHSVAKLRPAPRDVARLPPKVFVQEKINARYSFVKVERLAEQHRIARLRRHFARLAVPANKPFALVDDADDAHAHYTPPTLLRDRVDSADTARAASIWRRFVSAATVVTTARGRISVDQSNLSDYNSGNTIWLSHDTVAQAMRGVRKSATRSHSPSRWSPRINDDHTQAQSLAATIRSQPRKVDLLLRWPVLLLLLLLLLLLPSLCLLIV